jgi:hypothetical protein
MPVESEWDDTEKTAIRLTISGKWTWDELRECVIQCNAMIESVEHHVHFICIMGSANWIPGNALSNLRNIIGMFAHSDGYRMIVTENLILKDLVFGLSAMSGGLGFRYRFVTTLADARAYLANHPPRPRKRG